MLLNLTRARDVRLQHLATLASVTFMLFLRIAYLTLFCSLMSYSKHINNVYLYAASTYWLLFHSRKEGRACLHTHTRGRIFRIPLYSCTFCSSEPSLGISRHSHVYILACLFYFWWCLLLGLQMSIFCNRYKRPWLFVCALIVYINGR